MTYPIAKLGEVAEFIRGITFKPDDLVPLGGDDAIVCMRTKNVQAILDCEDLLAVPSKFVRREAQYLAEGDILVSSANSWNLVGKCCWVPSLPWRAAFGGFISVLRGNPERVDRRYLYQWFASERTQTLLRSFGQKTTNISNLNIGRCLQLVLPLPPRSEQRRIAAILDKADALRARRRDALAQLDRLAQSIFLETFGDPVANPKGLETVELQDLIAPGDGINYGVIQPGDDLDEGVPLVRVGDLVDGAVRHDALKKISPAIEAAYKRSRLVGDEILLSCVGSIGVVALVSEKERNFNIARAVARIRPKKEINREFLATQLSLPSVQAYFKRELRTVGQPTLNIKQIAETRVLHPPHELQHRFGEQFAALRRLRESHQMSIAWLNNMIDSFQHRAFRGEL